MFQVFLSCVAVLFFAAAAHAEKSGAVDRGALFKKQTEVLDGRAAAQYSDSERLRPQSVAGKRPIRLPTYRGAYQGKYVTMARNAARKHGVPQDLFLRLVQQESNWQPNAVSHKGAIGLAQLMPGTARYLGVNPRDPAQNLDGGARYLKEQYRKFRSWPLALAAYNAGPGAVEKYNGVPPYRETRNYIRRIWNTQR